MIISKIKFYINKFKPKDIKNKTYNFENNIDNNITTPKKELLNKYLKFKQTEIYKKQKEKNINEIKQTEQRLNNIKRLRERIAENIDIMKKFLKENKDIKRKDKQIIDNYLKFCIYYINNFKNLKILKILNLFLNYTIQLYIKQKEIKDLTKFKKQVKKTFELINKKIEASSIFKNLNVINFSINNFLLKNRNLLDDIEIKKDADKLTKISERRKRLRERKEQVKEVGDDISKAKNILERIKNINEKFNDD
jgi:hypothetical protein